MYDLSTNSNSGVHQFTVVIVEIILEFNTIGIDKFYCLIAFLVIVSIDDKSEITGLHLGLVEHPFVEEQILIAGGGHHKGDGAALGSGNGFARLIYGLVEFVSTFHHTVCFLTYGKVALKCHDVVIEIGASWGRCFPPPNECSE